MFRKEAFAETRSLRDAFEQSRTKSHGSEVTMRILYLLPTFPVLSETFILWQILGMIARGHDVYILSSGRPPIDTPTHPAIDEFKLFEKTRYFRRMPMSHVRRVVAATGLILHRGLVRPLDVIRALNVSHNGRASSSLAALFATLSLPRHVEVFDVIHCHFGQAGLLGAALANVGVIRGTLLVSFHGYDTSGYVKTTSANVYSPVFKAADWLLPVSDRLRGKLLALGAPPERTEVLHVGIPCEKFNFRFRFPNGPEPIRLLSIGRLVEKKGIEYALRGIAELKAAGVSTSYRVVGDGPLMPDLRTLAENLGLQDTITWLGAQPEEQVRAELNTAHILLAPSVTARDADEEGIPVSIMEAMAAGVPVIATRHAGIPELIEDSQTGMLVQERDFPGIARCIRHLVNDPMTTEQICTAARKRVVAEFNIHRQLDRIEQLAQAHAT